MKTLVVYHSVLGTTQKYAEWLSDALSADVFDFKHVTDGMFDQYDVVIVSSGTYAGKMPLVGFLTDHWEKLQHKKIIVVAVGIAPAEDEESKKSYELIPLAIREKIKYFKVPGKLFGIKPAGEPAKDKIEPVISYINHMQH